MPEPFDDYLNALRAAADSYRTDSAGSRYAAVSATVSFLNASNVDRSLTTPLMNLLGHLEDEHFQRAGNSNPAMINATLATAAAVITLARRTGLKLKPASELVAKHIGADGRDAQAEAKRLLQFRKNLMDDKASPDSIAVYYAMILRADESGMPVQDALALALAFLREKHGATSTI